MSQRLASDDELERVFQALLRGHIAGDDGESAHIQFGRIQREKYSDGVVGAGVGINDYFFGSCGRSGARRRNVDFHLRA